MRGRKRNPPKWSEWPWTIHVCDDRIDWLAMKLLKVQSPKRRARYERQMLFARGQKMAKTLTI
jgi:hypothetical protein